MVSPSHNRSPSRFRNENRVLRDMRGCYTSALEDSSMRSLKWAYKRFYALRLRLLCSYHWRLKSKSAGLSQQLRRENRTRWLDLGSSETYLEGFFFANLHPVEEVERRVKESYFQFNAAVEHSDEELSHMGTFDLIRMQHVFEHFTPEEAQIVLKNCHRLLNDGGYLLISVPDLEIFVNRYRHNCLDASWNFKDWAHNRIEAGSPQSYYFSIFTHSILYEAHKWCYDRDGLIFSINHNGLFKEAERLSLYHRLAELPFTHNRPEEDLCVLARKA